MAWLPLPHTQTGHTASCLPAHPSWCVRVVRPACGAQAPPPLPPRKAAGPTGCICLLHGMGVASWGLRLTPSILTAGKAVGLGISQAERAALTGLGAVMLWSWAWEGAWVRLPGRTLRVLQEPDYSWTAAQSCQGRSGERGPVWELLGGCPCEVPVGLPGRLSELLDQNLRVGLGLQTPTWGSSV